MLALLNTSHLHYLALLLGVFIAIRYRTTYGVTPGGLVIPGSLVILLGISPLWGFTMAGLTALVYGLYQQWFRRSDYRRRTPMYILAGLSLACSTVVGVLYSHLGWVQFSLDLQVGSILPGVMAFTMTQQSPAKVSRGIALCTGLTFVGVCIAAALLASVGDLPPTPAPSPTLRYPLAHTALALGVGHWIYRSQDIRSGGYAVAPIVAVTLLNPMTAVHFILGCVLVYSMTQAFCDFTLTVGLRRYVVVLTLSTLYVWGSELALQSVAPGLLLGQGYLITVAMLSCVNDAILYRRRSVLPYMGLMVGVAMAAIALTDVIGEVLA